MEEFETLQILYPFASTIERCSKATEAYHREVKECVCCNDHL